MIPRGPNLEKKLPPAYEIFIEDFFLQIEPFQSCSLQQKRGINLKRPINTFDSKSKQASRSHAPNKSDLGSYLELDGQIVIDCLFLFLSSYIFLQNMGGHLTTLPTHLLPTRRMLPNCLE